MPASAERESGCGTTRQLSDSSSVEPLLESKRRKKDWEEVPLAKEDPPVSKNLLLIPGLTQRGLVESDEQRIPHCPKQARAWEQGDLEAEVALGFPELVCRGTAGIKSGTPGRCPYNPPMT